MCGDVTHMAERPREDPSKADIRKAAETAPPAARTRLLAVADAQHGRPDELVGLDHEVPGGTVARWISQFQEGGLEALIDADLVTALDGEDPEPAAIAAYDAPPGVEKTALKAVARACRGSSVPELAQYYMVPETEVEEWIALFVEGGPEKLTARYRRRDWKTIEPGQAFAGRRKLPFGVTDTFLRNLHARSDGDFARHLLAITLACEGRTMVQVAKALNAADLTIYKWVNAFIRNGVAGIAPFRPAGQVPCRRDFTASSVAALAAAAVNQEYRKRLLAISEAYRATPLSEIGHMYGFASSSLHAFIEAFEIYGPMGLSTGEATVTPEMRDDYTAERLRAIASETVGDDRCSQRLEAIAQLYEGVPMVEAAQTRLIGGLPALRMMVDRFNRFGHGITESFNAHLMAPDAPPQRRPPVVRIKVPVVVVAREMRPDFNAESLAELRDRVRNRDLFDLDIVIDTYNGVTCPQIMQERGIQKGHVNRILNRFNDSGIDWLLGALKRGSQPERIFRQKVAQGPKTARERNVPQEPRFPLRTDWNSLLVRKAIFRTVDEVHRQELEVVLHLYQAGKVSEVARRMEIPPGEVTRIASSFNMDGETIGVERRLPNMLPTDHDADELKQAMRSEEPLRTYAQIVSALYGGRNLGYVRTTWELEVRELETIVRTFRRKGLEGLEADPLNARAQLPAPREAAAAPKAVAEPPKLAAEPRKPAKAKAASRPPQERPSQPRPEEPPITVPAAVAPPVPALPAALPRRATLADRLRSYSSVASPPHDRALVAVLLNTEGGSVNAVARQLAIPPSEVEAWINLYQRRGAKAFLSAERLSLHPRLPQDKGSVVRERAQKTEDEIYEKRLLIVADSINGHDMVSICERHSVAYNEAAECIAAYDRNGLAGIERADTPASMVDEIVRKAKAATPRRSHMRPRGRSPQSVAREYRPPAPSPGTAAVVAADNKPEVAKPSITAMFEGRNSHRLEAVREFNRDRNLHAVARKFNVGPQTLEKWVIAYVKTGMAEKDRLSALH